MSVFLNLMVLGELLRLSVTSMVCSADMRKLLMLAFIVRESGVFPFSMMILLLRCTGSCCNFYKSSLYCFSCSRFFSG